MNTQSIPRIRAATVMDARNLARLINIAGEGIPNWLWTRDCIEGQTPLDVGTERATRSRGGFSFANALIEDLGDIPVGMVLSYAIDTAPDGSPDDLPPPIAPFIALEKQSVGTWYINALAVFAEYRGGGTGSRLLLATESLARSQGYREMSIQVYGQNSGAVRLYERHGYVFAAKEPVRLHPSPPYYTGDVLLLKKRLDR